MWARPSWVPLNMAPQTVVPMPSSSGSALMRSASRSLARVRIPAIASSICSPSWRVSPRASSWMVAALARSPAAAPPMPSATTIIVGEV